MKALVYKELKLAMHPICYIFVVVFPFMIFIPNYPVSISFIYVLCTYPILFLGANKGQQSNDLLYSTLLPVRKKDIVLSRLITVAIIQCSAIVISAILAPFANALHQRIIFQAQLAHTPVPTVPGLTLNGYLSIVGIVLVGYALADLIFFPIYYKKGKSIVLSTILTILFFTIFITFFTIVLPYLNGLDAYKKFLCDSGFLPQLLIFGIGLISYFIIHYFVYKISSRNLEKVDF